MGKEFFMGIYCPPSPPVGEYPSKITRAVYLLLKRIGIKHIYGYYEEMSGEQYLKDALDLCAENGMCFYPRLSVFDKFVGREGAVFHPPYGELSEAEQKQAIEEFISWMGILNEHPGCGGILISDERPYEAFEGMGVASDLFASYCPDKEFHYNALNYFGDDTTMFYRNGEFQDKDILLVGDLEYNAENRFNRYKIYLDKYLDTCQTKHLSTDVYPFAPTWKEVPTAIHRALYETSTILATYRKDRHLACYHCVQVGDWDLSSRVIDRAETALHMNIAATYQLDGYIFFPGVFPNDWIMDDALAEGAHGKVGLLDCTGKPTIHYGYVEKLIEHMQTCAPVLLNANWLGVCTTGEFVGGFGNVNFSEIDWSECIYQGGLPENETYAYTGEIPNISTTSQLFIGVFETEESSIYFITNNSIVTDVTFEVKEIDSWDIIMEGKHLTGMGTLKISNLNAGESVLLSIKK